MKIIVLIKNVFIKGLGILSILSLLGNLLMASQGYTTVLADSFYFFVFMMLILIIDIKISNGLLRKEHSGSFSESSNIKEHSGSFSKSSDINMHYVEQAMQFIAIYENLHLRTIGYFATPTRFGVRLSDDLLGRSIISTYELTQKNPGPVEIWCSIFTQNHMEELGGEITVKKMHECMVQVGLYNGDIDYPVFFIDNCLYIGVDKSPFLEVYKYLEYIEKKYKLIYKKDMRIVPYQDNEFNLTSCFDLQDNKYALLERKQEELRKTDSQARRNTREKIHNSPVFQTIFFQITTCLNNGIDTARNEILSRIGMDTFYVIVQLNKVSVVHFQKNEPSDSSTGQIKLNLVFKDLAADELDYEQGHIFYLELVEQLKNYYGSNAGVSISHFPEISLEQHIVNSRWIVNPTLDGVSLKKDYITKRDNWDKGDDSMRIDIDLKGCHPKTTYGTW